MPKTNENKRLIRAEAIVEMLRIFYPNQVERAENLADLAMKTPDNSPLKGEAYESEVQHG
jgi:hypothetical protein